MYMCANNTELDVFLIFIRGDCLNEFKTKTKGIFLASNLNRRSFLLVH